MKKLLAITLSVIMLMTAFPLSSFALFGKLPEVESITFETDDPIYYSTLKEDLDSLEEYAEFSGEELAEEYYLYDIFWQLNDYEITLTFTDGTSLVLNEDIYETESYEIWVYADVDIREAVAAFENGEKTVPVEIYAIVENDYKESRSESIIENLTIQERCFTSIEYISGLPEAIGEFTYDLDLTGYKFKVTYFDGTEELVELQPDEYYDFLIDGKYLSHDIDTENQKIIFECFDAECEVDINVIEYPFSDIYFISCSRDMSTHLITAIECEVYMKDDSVETITADDITYIVPDDPEEAPYAVIGQVAGYDVILTTMVDIDETYPSSIHIFDVIDIGGTGVYTTNYESYIDENINPVMAFLMRLVSAFYRIVDFIKGLFA